MVLQGLLDLGDVDAEVPGHVVDVLETTTTPGIQTEVVSTKKGEGIKHEGHLLAVLPLSSPIVVGRFPGVNVFLMRHGEAGESSRGDALRTLTPRGQSQAHAAALGLRSVLRRHGIRPALLWHSPYVRAEQTATIVGETLGLAPAQDDRWTPDADPDVAARAVRAGPPAGLIAVAHLPILPAVVSALQAGQVSLGTASVVHLVLDHDRTRLEAVWTADELGRLHESDPSP
jgi:phosphohistidine phosphatase